MAFGFGPGAEMMKSVRSNRSQLGKKKSLKDTHEQYKGVEDKDKSEFKKVSESEINAFKEKFKEKQKKEKRQDMILIGFVAIVVLSFFYYVLF
ncbi:hypothetical protein [Aquimarina sediminis]|uniref:hypothetical protein n=1 Tax=Aquimarina sediminis TaxID=2070536 RepID=UPI000CA03812|nr:hypothetical protein [Aquimarina sediminis]